MQKADLMIGLVFAMEGLASLHVNQGQAERAAQLFAWADAMREKMGDPRPPVEQASVESDLAVIHSKLTIHEFTHLSAEGRTMTMEQAIELALKIIMNNSSLPNGTVTFLFTDIEGSTKLSQQHPDAMPALLARHNRNPASGHSSA